MSQNKSIKKVFVIERDKEIEPVYVNIFKKYKKRGLKVSWNRGKDENKLNVTAIGENEKVNSLEKEAKDIIKKVFEIEIYTEEKQVNIFFKYIKKGLNVSWNPGLNKYKLEVTAIGEEEKVKSLENEAKELQKKIIKEEFQMQKKEGIEIKVILKNLKEKYSEEGILEAIEDKYFFTFYDKLTFKDKRKLMGYRHALLDYRLSGKLYKIKLEDQNPKEYYEEKKNKLMENLVPLNDDGLYLFIIDKENVAYIQYNEDVEGKINLIFETKEEVDKTEEMKKKMDTIFKSIIEENKENDILKLEKVENNRYDLKKYKTGDIKKDKYYLKENSEAECKGSLIKKINERGLNIPFPSIHEKPRYCFFEENNIYNLCNQCYEKIKVRAVRKENLEIMNNFIELKDKSISGVKIVKGSDLNEKFLDYIESIRDYFHNILRFIDIRKFINNQRFDKEKNIRLGFESYINFNPSSLNKKQFLKLFDKSIIKKYNYLIKLDNDNKRKQHFNMYLLSMIEGGYNDWPNEGKNNFLEQKKNLKIKELEFKKYWNFLKKVKENKKLEKYWNEEEKGSKDDWIEDRKELYDLFEQHYKDPNEQVVQAEVTSEGISEEFSATSSEPVPVEEQKREGIIKVKLYNVTEK